MIETKALTEAAAVLTTVTRFGKSMIRSPSQTRRARLFGATGGARRERNTKHTTVPKA
jgi:hypothetical protein